MAIPSIIKQYNVWRSMRERTLEGGAHQAKCSTYRGVRCDARWGTFEGFLLNPPTVADGHVYSPGMHLSRVGDIGDYSPENARWRTGAENQREMLERRMVRLPDGRFAVDVARANGIEQGCWAVRVRNGWDIEAAVSAPPGSRRGPSSLVHRLDDGRVAVHVAADHGINGEAYHQRVRKGWDRLDAATAPLGSRRTTHE